MWTTSRTPSEPPPQDLEPERPEAGRRRRDATATPRLRRPRPRDSTSQQTRSRGFEALAGARSSTTERRGVVSTVRSLRSLLDHLSRPGRQARAGAFETLAEGSLLNHRTSHDGPTNQNPAAANHRISSRATGSRTKGRDATATPRLRQPRPSMTRPANRPDLAFAPHEAGPLASRDRRPHVRWLP